MGSLAPVVLVESERLGLVSLTWSSRVPAAVGFSRPVVLVLAGGGQKPTTNMNEIQK